MHQVQIDSVLKDNLKNLNLGDFLTVSFFIIDEIYQSVKHLVSRPGPEPRFSDSEVICLNLVGQMVCDSENGWYKLVKKNHLPLFPKLLERSRYHRRCKDLQQLTEVIRCKFLFFMDNHLQKWFIMDSLPVPVCVYVRASRNLRFATDFGVDNADLYGHCASKKEDIYGFKLHLLTSTQGIPTHYVLAPAAHHDVVIAPELLESYTKHILTIFDKGYVGLQKRLTNPQDYQLIIQKKENQEPNTPTEKAFLGIFRKTIETTNSLLAGQFNLQFTRAKSAWGLTNRVIAKVTSLTLSIYLNYLIGEPLLQVKGFIF
jgi:hypothetical protein